MSWREGASFSGSLLVATGAISGIPKNERLISNHRTRAGHVNKHFDKNKQL